MLRLTRARRRLAVRVAVVVAMLTLTITGLAGAYSYWQSYYVHRGFAVVKLVKQAERGHTVSVSFYSRALHRQADYLVYLPPGYGQSAARYPVYYLLHGAPGRPSVFLAVVSIGIRMDNLIAEQRMRPMIMVFPDGRIAGDTLSDSEWANTPTGDYESYVLNVVSDVDHRFATLPTRRDRVIAGFSAGAFGATNITLHHLNVFANLQSWSGYYRETHYGVFARASKATMAYNSPIDFVRRLRRRLVRFPLRAFLFTGRDDNLSRQTIPFALALAKVGGSVSYALYPGGHDWQLWSKHVDQMMITASRDTELRLVPGRGHAHTLTPGVKPLPRGLGRRRHRKHRRRRLGSGLSPIPAYLNAALVPVAGPRPPRASHDTGTAALLLGLLLALVSAALINLGFLLQHRGLSQTGEGGLWSSLRRAWRNRTWLGGQVLGWTGFIAQIVAVAIAPLSLVQSFAAGGLALSVPLASRFFQHRITRAQMTAVLLIAVGLAVLPIGFATGRDHLHGPALAITMGLAAAAALALTAGRRAALHAVAGGIFYGLADAAIKAVSVSWSAHGFDAVVSAWTGVAAAATFAGFVAFQASLRQGSAISAISLMNALTAVVALACGALAFEESLGTNVVTIVVHLIAIVIVLGCVPVLAEAQAELAELPEPARDRPGPRLEPTYEAPG